MGVGKIELPDHRGLKVLIDMDEVLVDFVGGACHIHGTSPEAIRPYRGPEQWSIVPALATVLKEPKFNDARFWWVIDKAGVAFWERLRAHVWMSNLIDWVESQTSNWYIVSDPSESAWACTGKTLWLKRVFGQDFDRFIFTGHKHLLATDCNTVLIDDRQRNIHNFELAGGRGILFPSVSNGLFPHADNPLPHVCKSLETYTVGSY